MRIITGKLRGLKLLVPAGLSIRPTSDRVKESVFAILGDKLVEATVLDLFGGSGNLSLEAVSRGAREVVCVDNNPISLKCINANVQKAKAVAQVKIYRNDALKSIALLHRENLLFNIIFCDPPYNKNWTQKILEQIKNYNIVAKSGIIVIEYSQHEKFVLPSDFHLFRQEKYGETMVAFLQLHK